MKILAFDIATNTGVCFGAASDTPLAWSVNFGNGQSDKARFSKVLKFTKDCIERYNPDYLAVECPIGGRTSSQFLIGIYSCVIGQATLMKTEVLRYQVSTIRKHFLGKHITSAHYPHLTKAKAKAEIKQCVIRRCQSLGWEVPDDDAADAAALWSLSCAKVNADNQMALVGGLFK